MSDGLDVFAEVSLADWSRLPPLAQSKFIGVHMRCVGKCLLTDWSGFRPEQNNPDMA